MIAALVWTGALATLLFSLPFALAAPFALQVGIGSAILTILALAAGMEGWVYTPLAVTLGIALFRLLPFFPVPRTEGEAEIKILQCNAWMRHRGTRALRRLIEKEQPDIIVVAEVNSPCARMLRDLVDYPHRMISIGDTEGTGLAVLSRFAPDGNFETLHLATPRLPSFFFTFRAGSKRIHMVAMHAANPVHYPKQRDDEFTAFAAWHAREKPATLILAGDLNATPFCPALKKMLRVTGLRDPRRARGFFGTFPVRTRLPFLRIPIDHILHSADLRVEKLYLGDETDSDHLPLIATFKVPS
jgi:endonuclease/exonuclease/phosphatase (EEP) superfamily protein YafD